MDKINKTLCELVLYSSLVGVGALGILNIMAAEPMIMLTHPKRYIHNFTVKEYTQDYQTTFGKVFGHLVYPGAKLGRWMHNSKLEDRE